MTNKEINKLIKESKSSSFLNSLEIEFNFKNIEIVKSLKGFEKVYQYINRQLRGWSKITLELPKPLSISKEYFINLNNDLKKILISKDVESEWDNLINNYIKNRSYSSSYNQDNIFTYDSPYTSFLIDNYSINENVFHGSYNFLFNKIEYDELSNSDYFSGVIKAYEFKYQDATKITKRSRYEKSSNNRLRNNFEHFISNSKNEIEKLANEIEKLKDEKNTNFELWYKKVKKRESDRYSKTKKNDSDYSLMSINRAKELEQLYSDKLMLSEPAEYWSKRAKELKKEATIWLRIVIASVLVSAILLIIVLSNISNGTLAELFSKTGSAIRWSIAFITLVSFLAYSVKIFSKLAFSSYHLARDAEERKQLVYVYLSLKNSNSIADNERILILQSIFSRSDTGLLKEDSAPTMPNSANGLINKIITSK